MRVRQVIENEVDSAFEANTTYACAQCNAPHAPVGGPTDHEFVRGNPVNVVLPTILLIQVVLETLLDIREVLIVQAMQSGKIEAQTAGGIKIPGQPGFRQ
jgi:hypothetical protein